jgi:hypothetical protein
MSAPGKMPRRQRDLRLDFFRGLAMLVIFIAHVPGNSWNGYIPARFGFSNATEMFVFGSGFASALAFGGIFVRHGWWLGVARILQRCWQVYWAHVGLFLVIAALYFFAHSQWPSVGYIENQGLEPFVQQPYEALMAMITLRWQADYLDILPMYLVILLLVPVMMAARRAHPFLPFVVAISLYGASWSGIFDLTGNPWNGRSWYFNPFAWQLIFFLGFAFAAGWIRPVKLGQKGLLWLASAYLAAALPLSFWAFQEIFPPFRAAHEWLLPAESQQTYLNPLRVIHFLAFAYVVLSLIEPWRTRIGQGWSAHVVKVGQQSLAAFLTSLALARLCGILLDLTGRTALPVAAINLAGLLLVIAAAYLTAWFKSSPWSAPVSAVTAPVKAPERVGSHEAITPR